MMPDQGGTVVSFYKDSSRQVQAADVDKCVIAKAFPQIMTGWQKTATLEGSEPYASLDNSSVANEVIACTEEHGAQPKAILGGASIVFHGYRVSAQTPSYGVIAEPQVFIFK
ncbi:MAG: hypothetical protein LRY76_04615 [Alphaproteobacteria bacterium]|nr:hypothetical protein [Alphaproteobacteria bacterium]